MCIWGDLNSIKLRRNVLLTRLYQGKCARERNDNSASTSGSKSKRKIMVGTNHQAQLPENLRKYDDALPYDNEDTLMWDPRFMNTKDIEEYLAKATEPGDGTNGIPMGNHTRDDEGALLLLLQCGYNTEEALRRLKLNTSDQTPELPWSEEECTNFEEGLKLYGKKFRSIHLNKLRTRTIGEIVRFYYLWKKTERYDMYVYKSRVDKKKYYLRPGLTDYMAKFFDGDEQRPLQSIVYGDPEWKPDEKSVVKEKKKKHSDEEE